MLKSVENVYDLVLCVRSMTRNREKKTHEKHFICLVFLSFLCYCFVSFVKKPTKIKPNIYIYMKLLLLKGHCTFILHIYIHTFGFLFEK